MSAHSLNTLSNSVRLKNFANRVFARDVYKRQDVYYTQAVIWAENNGIVKGYSEVEFAPDKLISRE